MSIAFLCSDMPENKVKDNDVIELGRGLKKRCTCDTGVCNSSLLDRRRYHLKDSPATPWNDLETVWEIVLDYGLEEWVASQHFSLSLCLTLSASINVPTAWCLCRTPRNCGVRPGGLAWARSRGRNSWTAFSTFSLPPSCCLHTGIYRIIYTVYTSYHTSTTITFLLYMTLCLELVVPTVANLCFRLETLILQAVEQQKTQCAYHNTCTDTQVCYIRQILSVWNECS